MRTAIIVINKDDPGIRDTVAALVALPEVVHGDAEVIVVDASQGRFDDLRQRHRAIRWIEFEPIAGRSSIPDQRNEGVRHAAAEVVVFTDASCVPGPDWLQRLCEPIWNGDETIVAGAHRSPAGGGLRDQATARQAGLSYVPEAPTINLALTRKLLRTLGGFDETFRYGSDVDLTWRAVDAGHRIRYVPEAYVVHDWGGAQDEIRRSFAYGRARAHLYLKHPGRWRDLLGRDSPLLAYPLLLLASPLFIRKPAGLALFVVPLIRNRGRRPVLTVGEHLVYGAGALAGLRDHARLVRKRH